MTSRDLEIEGEEILKSVEHSDGKPIVISRYGFKIIDIDGKKYVVAATPEELADQRAKHFGRSIDEVREEISTYADRPSCGGIGPHQCYPYNGCKQCHAKYIGSGVYDCVCVG